MQKTNFLIIFALCLQVQALTFDSNFHCSCESLTVDECLNYRNENCMISGSKCIDYSKCIGLSETDCVSQKYDCKWDQQCVDYSYQCSDFNSNQVDCLNLKCEWKNSSCNEIEFSCSNFKSAEECPSSNNCYWNKNNQCEEFSQCENYSSEECPKYGCKKTANSCITLNCSDIVVKSECTGKVDEETSCAWRDGQECVELINKYTCTDLDDYIGKCYDKSICKYEFFNGCLFTTCQDYSIDNCELRKAYVGRTEYHLCTVSESKCVELTEATQLKKDNCRYETSSNYHWTIDGKCEECAELISESYSEIIFGVILIIIIVE